MPRFDLEQFLACTRSTASPAPSWRRRSWWRWPSTRSSTQYDLSARRAGLLRRGAAVGRARRSRRGKRLGCEVVQGYGMTELSPVSHLHAAGHFKPGSVGVTVPNTELRIVDPATGEDLGVDEDGELWVRGPQVMKGYLNNQEATAPHDRRRRLAAHRRHRPRRRRRPRLRRRPAQGAHQVQGLPGAAGRARGAAAHPPGRRRRRRHRRARRGGGRDPGGVRRRCKPGSDAPPRRSRRSSPSRSRSTSRCASVAFVDAIPKSASGKILRRVLRAKGRAD